MEKTLEVIGDSKINGIERKRKMVQHTLSFLKIHHDKGISSLDVVHPGELAYLRIKQGKKIEARKLLNQLNEKNGRLTDIQTAYLGLTYEGTKRRVNETFSFDVSKIREYILFKFTKNTLGFNLNNWYNCLRKEVT